MIQQGYCEPLWVPRALNYLETQGCIWSDDLEAHGFRTLGRLKASISNRLSRETQLVLRRDLLHSHAARCCEPK